MAAIATPGTIKRRIGGIGSTFTMNGLTIGDTTAQDTVPEVYRVLRTGGFIETPDIRGAAQSRPDDHGEDPEQLYFDGRTLTIEGRIEAYSLDKLRDMSDALKLAWTPLTEKQLVVSHLKRDSLATYINCRASQKIAMTDEQKSQSRYTQDFLITLRASSYPFFRSTVDTSFIILPTAISSKARFYNRTYPLTYPYAINAAGQLTLATNQATTFNSGTFESKPIVRIYGPLVNPVVKNVTTGKKLKFSVTLLGSDNYIQYDQMTGLVTDENGVLRGSYLITAQSDDFLIATGTNVITLDVDSFSTGAYMQLIYTEAFL